MTAALLDRPRTRQPATRTPAKPQLRVLNEAARRRRARHRTALLILFVAVLAGFFAVAFVHAELVSGQHDLDAVRAEISQAEARHAELARAVEEASAPAVIVERATSMGMVRAEQPVYLVAAGPERSVEVGRPLSATDPGLGQVAAADPSGAAASDGSGLRGSLGVAGGISAAVRLAPTPAFALGAEAETGAVTTATAPAAEAQKGSIGPAGTAASTSAEDTATPAGNTSGSSSNIGTGVVSTIAGTRAVTGPAPGSEGSTTSTGTPGGAGLASVAAATTSG